MLFIRIRKIALAVLGVALVAVVIHAIVLLVATEENIDYEIQWRWECQKGQCMKLRATNETRETALSLAACNLFCHDHAGIWPQPTGKVQIGNYLLHINPNSVHVSTLRTLTPISDLVKFSARRFEESVMKLAPVQARSSGAGSLMVSLDIKNPDEKKLTLTTDESYSLTISPDQDGNVNAVVTAETIFGSRHGLETLGQLIVYDDLRGELQIMGDANITDKPVYPYRGILLDTSRSYVSVDTIKRTIDGMASNKLNTFHWHITDSQSFPYVSKSRPEMSELGAYSRNKVYSPEDVADIVDWGIKHGVRVLPEFDAPAHVGEGWQDTGMVACFNFQPWQDYCVEPPCGQLDPTQDKLYDILEDIYGDMVAQFDPDIFHMGGDEVSIRCWNATESIVKWMESKGWGRTEADFMKLWYLFQTKALGRFTKQMKKDIPIIMWTSTLTKKEYIKKYLPNDTYIIQIWTTGSDPHIKELLEMNYKVILSNYDALYLDCGFASWVANGENWCAPYIGWQEIYKNSPAKIAGEHRNLMLGAEATLWTEQADDQVIDSRLWPRTAAMAERLWAEPANSWGDAESRMLMQRERLVAKGIAANTIQPQWCWQNQGQCPLEENSNNETKSSSIILGGNT